MNWIATAKRKEKFNSSRSAQAAVRWSEKTMMSLCLRTARCCFRSTRTWQEIMGVVLLLLRWQRRLGRVNGRFHNGWIATSWSCLELSVKLNEIPRAIAGKTHEIRMGFLQEIVFSVKLEGRHDTVLVLNFCFMIRRSTISSKEPRSTSNYYNKTIF